MESINSQNPDYSKTFLLEIKEEHIDQNHLIEEEINQLRQQHSNNHKKTEEDLKNPNIAPLGFPSVDLSFSNLWKD